MSGGYNKKFISNPKDFLKNYLLVVNVQAMVKQGVLSTGIARSHMKFTNGAVITANIRKTSRYVGRNASGKIIPACEVVEGSATPSKYSHQFPAFYLPFFNGQAKTMTLTPPTAGPAPGFYFTDEMTGCAFACGPGPSPKVGHFNFTVGNVEGALIDDAAVNQSIQNEFGQQGTFRTLKKADYKNDAAAKVTFIGIRKSNGLGWDYVYQRFTHVGYKGNAKICQIDAAAHDVV